MTDWLDFFVSSWYFRPINALMCGTGESVANGQIFAAFGGDFDRFRQQTIVYFDGKWGRRGAPRWDHRHRIRRNVRSRWVLFCFWEKKRNERKNQRTDAMDRGNVVTWSSGGACAHWSAVGSGRNRTQSDGNRCRHLRVHKSQFCGRSAGRQRFQRRNQLKRVEF